MRIPQLVIAAFSVAIYRFYFLVRGVGIEMCSWKSIWFVWRDYSSYCQWLFFSIIFVHSIFIDFFFYKSKPPQPSLWLIIQFYYHYNIFFQPMAENITNFFDEKWNENFIYAKYIYNINAYEEWKEMSI